MDEVQHLAGLRSCTSETVELEGLEVQARGARRAVWIRSQVAGVTNGCVRRREFDQCADFLFTIPCKDSRVNTTHLGRNFIRPWSACWPILRRRMDWRRFLRRRPRSAGGYSRRSCPCVSASADTLYRISIDQDVKAGTLVRSCLTRATLTASGTGRRAAVHAVSAQNPKIVFSGTVSTHLDCARGYSSRSVLLLLKRGNLGRQEQILCICHGLCNLGT